MRNEKQRRLKRLRCNPRIFIRWFLWGSQKCQHLPSKVCSMKEQTLRPLPSPCVVFGNSLATEARERGSGRSCSQHSGGALQSLCPGR